MTEYTILHERDPVKEFSRVRLQSDRVNLAGTAEISGNALIYPHSFIGVRMYDANGDATLGTGNFVIHVKTWNTGEWETPAVSIINSASPDTLSVAATVESIRVDGSGVTGITTFEVRISSHAS